RREAMQMQTQVAWMQTFNLIQKAMEEESDRATITHEGCRQLLTATGLLPRTLASPDWIHEGLASFLETPHRSFYPSVGLPSWTNLVQFKFLRKTKKLDKAENVLMQVVTNGYHRKAQRSSELLTAHKEKQEVALAKKAEEDTAMARATSWALVYYLAKTKKLDVLLRYCQELNSLPRDLEFDERALQACFERAFQLRDPAAVQAFATDWFNEMENVYLEIPDVERQAIDELENPPA